MSRFASVFDGSTCSGWDRYYDYEVELGRGAVLPWLANRIDLNGLAVGDFGCHAGGVLQALREDGRVASGEGFDIDTRAVEGSPFVKDDRFSIAIGDLRAVAGRQYDLVLLHDVLEHVAEPATALEACARTLRPEGALFVTFPPYLSPFGGHQHVAANWTRAVPYLHLLPARLFFRLVELSDNEYLAAEDLYEELRSVREARLTMGRAEAAFARAGFRIERQQLFLFRPEFSVRYDIRVVDAGLLGRIKGLREFVVMGAFYLLRKAAPRTGASA